MAKSPKLKKSARQVPPALEGFSFRATIDWIEIELTLATQSQWHHVKRRASKVWGNLYVDSLESNESSRKFRFRVQDPGTPDQWMRQLQLVARHGESLPESAVKIVGVEIAIDAYHPTGDLEALAQAALHFMVHQAILPAGPPRITAPPYFGAPLVAAAHAAAVAAHAAAQLAGITTQPPAKAFGEYWVPYSRLDALRHLRLGLSINQGKAPNLDARERGDSHRSRVYVKTKDTKNGVAYAPIPPKQCSARMENTWQDDDKALPFTTIEEWRNYRFENLSKRFALVLPDAPDKSMVALLQDHHIQLGRGPDSPKIRPSDRRQRRLFTRRDSSTNDKIRQALRGLTRAHSCGNSVKAFPTISLPSEGGRDLDMRGPKYINTNTETNHKSARQSPLTKTKPADGSVIQITQIVGTPRQEHKQSGQWPNQCGPPKAPTRRPYPPKDANPGPVHLQKSFFRQFVNRIKNEK